MPGQQSCARLLAEDDLEHALNAGRHPAPPPAATDGDHQRGGVGVTLVRELFGMLKPAVISLITGLVQNRVGDAPDDSNSHEGARYQDA